MKRLLWLLVIILFGCGGEAPPLPAAKPLNADSTELAKLPGFDKGPYTAAVVDNLSLNAPALDNPELLLRVWYPQAFDGEIPVVLFSHGNWSDREKYDNLLSHWASHGYAIIAPTHLDGRSMARGIFNSLRYGQLGLINARVDDLRYLLDNLAAVEALVAQASGQGIAFGKQSVVAAGHSFGAFSAQQLAGAQAWDITESSESPSEPVMDDRIAAVIAISPPGPMFDVIHDKSWLAMRGPVLVTTGTWDSNPQFWPDWRSHLLSHETAPAGDQYALVVEGADHYLGNLICRPEREAEPQRDALAMVNSASVAFLDAWLRGEDSVREFLEGQRLAQTTGGFVQWRQR